MNNYNNALETFGHCQQKSAVKQFFEVRSSNRLDPEVLTDRFLFSIQEGTEHDLNDQKLDLVSYLIMPIQRIPRYQLLLQVRTNFIFELTRVTKIHGSIFRTY